MIQEFINKLLKKETNITSEAIVNYPFIHEYNATRSKGKINAICHAPSTNMYFSQTGEVKVCCHNSEFVAGKYPEQSIKDIWNSNALKQMRIDMAKYKLGNGCEICSVDLKGKNFGEVRAKHFDHIPIHNSYPTQMEFLLTNTCNLECVMCKGEFSSSIRKNVENLPPIPNVYDDKFIEQLEEFIPYLHETRFSGSGEAFLIDANYKIWEKIIKINPACKIMVQTNGTVLNNKVKEILSKGNFHIGVSLDSLKKEVFESIRPNSKFERVIEHTHYFNEYCLKNNRRFNISTCVMRQNWMEMPDFIQFSNKLNAVQTFHKVWFPRQHAIFNLDSKELEYIYNCLNKYSFDSENELQKLNLNHYRYHVQVILGWIDEAKQLEVEIELLKGNDILKIKNFITNKLRVHLLDGSKDFEGNVEIKLLKLNGKIDNVLSMIQKEDLTSKALKEMAKADTTIIIDMLNNFSEQELYNMFEKHVS